MQITRAQLVQRCAQRANTSGYADPSPGGEISQLVDTSLAKLYNIFAGELYEDFNISRHRFPLVPNIDVYQTPSDFMKLRAIFYLVPQPGSTDLSLAQRYPLARLERSTQVTQPILGNITSLAYGYILEGTNLTIVPRVQNPTSGWVEIEYIPEYVPAVNDNIPISYAFSFGWDEWCVNDVCVNIRLKSMMPVQELQQERDAYLARVRIQAKNRNTVQPPQIRNTGWKYGGGFRGGISGNGNFGFS